MVRDRREGQPGRAHLRRDAPPAAFERFLEIDERARAVDGKLDRLHAELRRGGQRLLEGEVIEHLRADAELHATLPCATERAGGAERAIIAEPRAPAS